MHDKCVRNMPEEDVTGFAVTPVTEARSGKRSLCMVRIHTCTCAHKSTHTCMQDVRTYLAVEHLDVVVVLF